MADSVDAVSPVPAYIIRLLYENKPVVDEEALLGELKEIDPMIRPLGDGGVLMFVNENHIAKSIAGGPGSPVLICAAEKIDRQELGVALSQTWDWPAADDVVSTCPYAIIMSDMMGQMLEPRDRLANVQKILAALLKVAPPAAIHWSTSQRIVDPESLASELGKAHFDNIMCGAVNVRMYKVAGAEGNIVMDTLGMRSFGLPDLQCHYHSIEPSEVASCLYQLANYIFDKGAVIETGHTIDGADGARWQCAYEWSLAEPKREVIDLHPGNFAAGNR